MWIYLNDRFVKESEATVSVFDHGFLYGDGVYETIRSYGSRKIFMQDQHLLRLHRSADGIGLKLQFPSEVAFHMLHESMARNEVGNDSARRLYAHYVSRGDGDIGLDPALCPNPTVVIITKPLQTPSPEHIEMG